MSNVLYDGSVIPSYLGVSVRGLEQDTGTMSNTSLRTGEVREIVWPDDPKSISGKYVEYTVEVQEKEGNGPGTSTRYAGCLVANLFGSVGDILQFTLRSDTQTQKSDDGIGVGAKVAILCVNGDTTKAMIVGGFRDASSEDKDSKEDGHHLRFEFNGVGVRINDDGELKVSYKGKTKVNGKLDDRADASAEGSSIVFDKKGSIKLSTKDEAQILHIDHNNKTIEINADSEWKVHVNGRLSFDVGKSISINGGSSCSIEVNDNMTIKSSRVLVGSATDAWILGTTYRKAESILFGQIGAAMAAMQGAMAAAAAGLAAAATANAASGPAGAAAAPGFAAAAGSLAAVGPLAAQVSQAIANFEAQSATFLSKNLTD